MQAAGHLFDLSDGRSTRLSETHGWVPAAALTTEITRHHFHLNTTTPTPDNWMHDADVPGCRLFWLPLSSAQQSLVEPQNFWLQSVVERLNASAQPTNQDNTDL